MARTLTCGISVYPDFTDRENIRRNGAYIEKAAGLGYDEVFSSLHIPEKGAGGSLDDIVALGKLVRDAGMTLTLDLSAGQMRRFLADPEKLKKLRGLSIDWLRMDFGFDDEAIIQMVHLLEPKGLMCNASVLSEDEIDKLVPLIRSRLGLALRAHHNFYPRPETGLSVEFFCRKSELYRSYGVPVTACVAAFHEPRLPLFAGLPTVERHRALPSGQAAAELKRTGLISSILIGDPFAGDDELKDVADVCLNRPICLRVILEAGISEQEKQILLDRQHHARPDCAESSIRSQSTREMASQGMTILRRSAQARRRYDVTIDNADYCRYSGEMHILTRDLPADARVNVAAHIHSEDYHKVSYILPGTDFILVNEDE